MEMPLTTFPRCCKRRWKTGVPGKKPLGAEQKTNKLMPHIYDAVSGNRTGDTLVRGECFYHYAIPALPSLQNCKAKGIAFFFSITVDILSQINN